MGSKVWSLGGNFIPPPKKKRWTPQTQLDMASIQRIYIPIDPSTSWKDTLVPKLYPFSAFQEADPVFGSIGFLNKSINHMPIQAPGSDNPRKDKYLLQPGWKFSESRKSMGNLHVYSVWSLHISFGPSNRRMNGPVFRRGVMYRSSK